ncbi:MAG: hypothetical protein OHK0039_11780 [Bacteroidia bacterium]
MSYLYIRLIFPAPYLMRVLCLILLGWLPAAHLSAQSYTYWAVGDTSDAQTNTYVGGTVLAGGGGDNDEAMTWMLQRAGGGDVVVIRASNADGYNDYFYSELGVAVHSVETIRFDDASAATDSFVIRKIRGAEVLFIAGGDQYDYYQYWKDSPVEDAIHELISEKKITIGGTSAGMAILGAAYYAPSGASAQSAQVLADPFHPSLDVLGNGDFIAHPLLPDLITDTHYAQRDRQGRHMTFMARLAAASERRIYGIACNEYTVVCIDTAGLARVYGEQPDYDDWAFFLKTNCQPVFTPEVLAAGQPLTWNRGQAAVLAYKVPGTTTGAATFDLRDWTSGSGGTWENWYVDSGEWYQAPGTGPDCDAAATSIAPGADRWRVQVYPHPLRTYLHIDWDVQAAGRLDLRIWDSAGRLHYQQERQAPARILDVQDWPAGVYVLELRDESVVFRRKLLKL